jgi:hypothetical protein
MWKEKRSSARHVIELPIRYRELKVKQQIKKGKPSADVSAQKGETKNLSERGLLFVSFLPFAKGTTLELTLPMKDKVFTVRGIVVHATDDTDTGFFKIGVQFSNATQVFKVKMAEQLYQIEQYRKSLSKKRGRPVSEEEAARKWIQDHSTEFSEFY